MDGKPSPADPRDVETALSLALTSGRAMDRAQTAEVTTKVVAERLGAHLERSGFVICASFTSAEFDADADHVRYLCWTNRRLAEVNGMIRRWRYGDKIPTPFMPGERVLVRAPVLKGDDVVLQTNEEAEVVSIKEGTYQHEMVACGPLDFWIASIPSWKLKLERDNGETVTVHMPADEREQSRHRSGRRL